MKKVIALAVRLSLFPRYSWRTRASFSLSFPIYTIGLITFICSSSNFQAKKPHIFWELQPTGVSFLACTRRKNCRDRWSTTPTRSAWSAAEMDTGACRFTAKWWRSSKKSRKSSTRRCSRRRWGVFFYGDSPGSAPLPRSDWLRDPSPSGTLRMFVVFCGWFLGFN